MLPGTPLGVRIGIKRNRQMTIALAVLATAAILSVIGVGYSLFWARPSAELSKHVPETVELYIEVVDVKAAIDELGSVDGLDSSRVRPEEWLNTVSEHCAQAFKLPVDQTSAAIASIRSVGFAARDIEGEQQWAVLVSFDNGPAVTKWLGSSRFEEGDAIGPGKMFTLEALELTEEESSSVPPVAQSLWTEDLNETTRALAWFADHNLLVIGDIRFLHDIAKVIEGHQGSLEDRSNYHETEFERGAAIIGYFDTGSLEGSANKAVARVFEGYLDGATPLSMSVRLTEAGMVTTVTSTIAGDSAPEPELFAPAVELNLSERLPASTLAYVAFSSRNDLDAATLKKLLVRQVEDTDAAVGEQMALWMEQTEDGFGFEIEPALDLLGDQGVVAITAAPEASILAAGAPESVVEVGLVYLQQVATEDAANRMLRQSADQVLKGRLAARYTVRDYENGFAATPVDSQTDPYLDARVHDGYLIVGMGSKVEVKRQLAAVLDAEDTLEADVAHRRAIDAIGGHPHLLIWIDSGRVLRALPSAPVAAGAEPSAPAASGGAFVLEGPLRVTMAAALHLSYDDGWSFRFDTLNAPLAVPMMRALEAVPSDEAPEEIDLALPDQAIDPLAPRDPGKTGFAGQFASNFGTAIFVEIDDDRVVARYGKGPRGTLRCTVKERVAECTWLEGGASGRAHLELMEGGDISGTWGKGIRSTGGGKWLLKRMSPP